MSQEDVPIEVREETMKATFRAICEHGYADLTMEKIADETERCKSTLHYHYGTKENLMVDFIKFLLEGFKENIVPDTDDPEKKLNGLIDRMLFGKKDGEVPERFHTALLELRSQAPYSERYREQITENDEYIHDKVVEIIEEGIEKEKFEEVDSYRTTTVILSTIDGARARQLSTNRDAAENARESLDELLENLLIKDR